MLVTAFILSAALVPVEKMAVAMKVPGLVLTTSYQNRSSLTAGLRIQSGPRVAKLLEISKNEQGEIAVNGLPASRWRLLARPELPTYTIKNIKTLKQGQGTEIELSMIPPVYVTVRDGFGGLSLAEGFGEVFLPADSPAVAAYKRETRDAFQATYFQGPLAQLSSETKAALMRLAYDDERPLVRLRGLTHKGGVYLTMDVGIDDSVYNEEKLSQSQRIASLLTEKLLRRVREFAEPVRGVADLAGIKLEVGVPHESFIDTRDETEVDRLEIFMPMHDVQQFADADITAKKLLSASVILINGNRMEVPAEL